MTDSQTVPEETPGANDDVTTLTDVLERTAVLMDAVTPQQRTLPTPCVGWDVERLLAHLVGWSASFADRAEGGEPAVTPDTSEPGDHPGEAYRHNAARLLAALASPGQPPQHAYDPGLLVAENIVHGWDLATATDQAPTYTDEQCERGLEVLESSLLPEYRGQGFFEAEVEVPDGASALDRLVAFAGRTPTSA